MLLVRIGCVQMNKMWILLFIGNKNLMPGQRLRFTPSKCEISFCNDNLLLLYQIISVQH